MLALPRLAIRHAPLSKQLISMSTRPCAMRLATKAFPRAASAGSGASRVFSTGRRPRAADVDDSNPLVDLLGRSGTEAAQTVLYQNHQKWKIRAMFTFACTQGTYWMFVAYDLATRYLQGAPATPADASVLGADESLMIGFYTHPAWSVFGTFFSVAIFGAVRLFTSHYVSQVSLPAQVSGGMMGGPQIEICFHTMAGGVSEPMLLPASYVTMPEVKEDSETTETLVPLSLRGFRARVLVDTDGHFASNLRMKHGDGTLDAAFTLRRMAAEAGIKHGAAVAGGSGGQWAQPQSSIVERHEELESRRRHGKRR